MTRPASNERLISNITQTLRRSIELKMICLEKTMSSLFTCSMMVNSITGKKEKEMESSKLPNGMKKETSYWFLRRIKINNNLFLSVRPSHKKSCH
jgi:hypothetical protein